ncbi:hypothetical protein KAR91_67310, partial [Candidatus Pacearchaeota archaeon]|nr:hypothetical protein [Candidatus Pacearchaeota archaeon]
KKYFHLGMPSMSLDFLAENKTSIGYKQLLRLPHSAAYFGELLKKRLPEFVTTGKLKKRRHDRHDVSRRENKPYSPERVNGAIGFLGKSANNFTQHSDLNFQLLEQAVMLAHSHGNRTILVELPVNGAVAKGFAAFAPDYDTRIRTLAQKHGIEYFEFSKDGPWKNQYYRDHHHMIKAGWKKFTPLLAERLVQDLIETEKYSMSDN